MSRPAFRYEKPERFGESLTTARPWNRSALTDVERLNGRVAMLGFLAAVASLQTKRNPRQRQGFQNGSQECVHVSTL